MLPHRSATTRRLPLALLLVLAASAPLPAPGTARGEAARSGPASPLVPFRQGRLWGFIDRTGRELFDEPPLF